MCCLVIALTLAGCGGSSSNTSGDGGLTGQSTCSDWTARSGSQATAAKNAYLKRKGVEVGSGTEGEAISAWIDYLCGKSNPTTSYSPQTSIDDVFLAAQQQFTDGATFPPVAQTKTAS